MLNGITTDSPESMPPAPQPSAPLQAIQTGLDHHGAGRLAEAEKIYRQVLLADPGNADALHWLGVIAHQVGKNEAAVQLIDAALSANPDNAEALSNRGLAMQALGRYDEALTSYSRALAIKPQFSGALYNLGNAFRELGRYAEALASYDKALAIRPDYPEALSNRGSALHELMRYDEALASYDRALAISPQLSRTHCSRGNLLRETGRLEEALDSYDRAISIEPGYAEALSNRGLALQACGRVAEAIDCYRKALDLKPDYDVAHSNAIFALDLVEGCGAREQQEERRRWFAMHGLRFSGSIRPYENTVGPERKLRIGYVSADFRRHAASYAFGPVIRRHDSAAFEVVCYSGVTLEDEITFGLRKAAELWRTTTGVSDEALAEQIRRDRIDILVDLSAHMGGNRLLVFARKPAPIQVTAWGYPNGTGMATIDYLFSDPVVIPASERGLYAEEVVDLSCFLCYEPPEYLPGVAPLPALSGKPFTFGCICRIEKISERAMRLWGRILAAAPESILLVKGTALEDAELRRDFKDRLARAGIGEDRVRLIGQSSHLELLKTFDQIDLALDPLPHGGAIGTAEALWMGVPVVAIRGDTFMSRISASILSALDLGEWIALDETDYVNKAVRASGDLEGLARARTQIRPRLASSIFGNAQAYTRSVESAYRAMWRRWCENR